MPPTGNHSWHFAATLRGRPCVCSRLFARLWDVFEGKSICEAMCVRTCLTNARFSSILHHAIVRNDLFDQEHRRGLSSGLGFVYGRMWTICSCWNLQLDYRIGSRNAKPDEKLQNLNLQFLFKFFGYMRFVHVCVFKFSLIRKIRWTSILANTLSYLVESFSDFNNTFGEDAANGPCHSSIDCQNHHLSNKRTE